MGGFAEVAGPAVGEGEEDGVPDLGGGHFGAYGADVAGALGGLVGVVGSACEGETGPDGIQNVLVVR